jgi:single-stranded-DNA-specific exonuclease
LPTLSKSWQLLAHDRSAIERMAGALRVAPIVAHLLLNRRLDTPEVAAGFLKAPLTGLCEPERLPGVTEAAERLFAAVREGRRICIYGDYDVDGVTGTAILLSVLRLLGAAVEFHVPHRLQDGYGLNIEALKSIKEGGAALVVTVDCGITSLAEAAEAERLGLELIITDHHEPKAELPCAPVLVHPRLRNGAYPFGGLSGAGVAFKVAWALGKMASRSDKVTPPLREVLLDGVAMAAMGTVADVMPLEGENRILVRHGLARLMRTPCEGLKALLQASGLSTKPALAAMDIGFTLAPRLNAAGRLGSARLAVELLTTPSPQRAADLARFLEEQNQQRQIAERKLLHEARELAGEATDMPAFVLAKEGWHPGLIGIVAGRLMETLGRPVLMIALFDDGKPATGSGRSIPGFKLHHALELCGSDLLSHGGHAAAAGFRIAAVSIDRFRERFCAVADGHFRSEPPHRRLVLDAELPLAALTTGLCNALTDLEPFGAGNPQPLFLAGDVQVVGEPRRVGGGERHLSFRVRQNGRELRSIAFGMADRAEELMSAQGKCCLAFTPRINEWQGRRSVELEIRDLQAGPKAQLS